MIIQATSAVVAGEVIGEVWLEVQNGIIKSVNLGRNSEPNYTTTGCLIPGFVDIHCHGGGSKSFSSLNPDEVQEVIDTHRRHGSTSVMASLVSEPIAVLKEQILSLKPFVSAGNLVGIHLEGPYLSRDRCGAHDPSLLGNPNLSHLKELVELAEGAIKMVTLAPELPGAFEAIEYLVSVGAKVALGHTSGQFKDAQAGTSAGASIITHLTNGMDKSLAEGSFAAYVLQDRNLYVELILDGLHIPFATAKELYSALGHQAILITDAMAAAGSQDGQYLLGKLPVQVTNGVARLESTHALAGSTLTMGKAFTNAIDALGISLAEAVAATSSRAAKSIGLHDRGEIAVGKRADLLSYDEKMNSVTLINV